MTFASTSGLTLVDPLTTRDTVDRETPAAAATSSSVGGSRRDWEVLMTSLYKERFAMMRWYSRALSLSVRCWVS
ncbi:hypothetical protein GCM10027413_04320 [Conyzicola nivalis]|uniref:Uncharacterized protein n=1 Tax=Conyzicola nivalis TaxID=1477021 RepID=A0A916WJJ0_9MICO|nr:hypothetical protein GCM10010979_22310 [Conyzicola nivalis]